MASSSRSVNWECRTLPCPMTIRRPECRAPCDCHLEVQRVTGTGKDFMCVEEEPWRWNDLPKVTQLVGSKDGIGTGKHLLNNPTASGTGWDGNRAGEGTGRAGMYGSHWCPAPGEGSSKPGTGAASLLRP